MPPCTYRSNRFKSSCGKSDAFFRSIELLPTADPQAITEFMELPSAASLLARFRDVASTALISAWVKKKHKSALRPAQEPVLKTPHHRIDHEPHSQHHDDIGKDCRAFEKALRIDQSRAHAAATCNHLGGKGGDKAHRHDDPERRKNTRIARRQNHMQE